MKLVVKEQCFVAASPEKIWETLCDLELMKIWNPKCVRCEPAVADIGVRFKAWFSLGRRENEHLGEVVDCRPFEKLEIRYDIEGPDSGVFAIERFLIEAKGEGCSMIHEVDMTNAGLPWFVKLIAKFLHSFGRSVGESSLERLRDLCETGSAS